MKRREGRSANEQKKRAIRYKWLKTAMLTGRKGIARQNAKDPEHTNKKLIGQTQKA